MAALLVCGMILSAVIGPFAAAAISIGLALWRAVYRTRLRRKLGIEGGQTEDFGLHLCCGPCAIAQEARQAKSLNLPAIEFFTGELLPPTVTMDASADGPGFWAQLTNVSKCSKLILAGSSMLLIVAAAVSSRQPGNILILALALLEPIIILYLVYWRNHKKDASLDSIIKLFAVGFYWTSQFAGMTEPVLEILLFTVGGVLGLVPTVDAQADDAAADAQLKAWAKANMAVVLVALLFTSFVVAAGVEETYKFLIVRFCTFGGPLRNPHTILIYLISGAAGFSCAENIAYVFGFNEAMKGVSALAGELYVLGLRALMPIHVICAGLQAINYIKVVVEDQPMPTWQVLLPAMALHGSFDFILMLLAALQFMYDLDENALNIASLTIGVVIAVVSLLVTMKLWSKQQERLGMGWHRVEEVEIQVVQAAEVGEDRPPTNPLLAMSPTRDAV